MTTLGGDLMYYIGSMPFGDEDIQHFGVKGMKWGIRRTPEQLNHKYEKKTIKEARKDAKRHVDAQMYYGKGAGTRRKLLKAELEGKMKDPLYKNEFEKAVAVRDRGESAVRARRERHVRDVTHKVTSESKAFVHRCLRTTGPILGTVAAMAYLQSRSK